MNDYIHVVNKPLVILIVIAAMFTVGKFSLLLGGAGAMPQDWVVIGFHAIRVICAFYAGYLVMLSGQHTLMWAAAAGPVLLLFDQIVVPFLFLVSYTGFNIFSVGYAMEVMGEYALWFFALLPVAFFIALAGGYVGQNFKK